jgi:hypothetical protein
MQVLPATSKLVLTIFRSVTFMCMSSSGLPDFETLVFSFSWLIERRILAMSGEDFRQK